MFKLAIIRDWGPYAGSVTYGTSFTTLPVTLPIVPTEGKALVCVAGINLTSTPRTITAINETNVTWTRQVTQTASGELGIEIWYGTVGPSAGTVLQIVYSGSDSAGARAQVAQYSGMFLTGFLDKTASTYSTGATTIRTGTTSVTASSVELWIGGITSWSSGTYTTGTPENTFTVFQPNPWSFSASSYFGMAYFERTPGKTDTAWTAQSVSANIHYQGAVASFYGEVCSISSVTASPYFIHRTESETVTLTCSWTDDADYPISNYLCKFWVRDPTSSITYLGEGSISKPSAKNYTSSIFWDPSVSYPLGTYDIRVWVTKYG